MVPEGTGGHIDRAFCMTGCKVQSGTNDKGAQAVQLLRSRHFQRMYAVPAHAYVAVFGLGQELPEVRSLTWLNGPRAPSG